MQGLPLLELLYQLISPSSWRAQVDSTQLQRSDLPLWHLHLLAGWNLESNIFLVKNRLVKTLLFTILLGIQNSTHPWRCRKHDCTIDMSYRHLLFSRFLAIMSSRCCLLLSFHCFSSSRCCRWLLLRWLENTIVRVPDKF